MICQFDVVANPDAEEAVHWPYLVVLQSDLISGLRSTVVAPLVSRPNFEGARRLNPIVVVEGHEFWLATHELFAVDQRILRKRLQRCPMLATRSQVHSIFYSLVSDGQKYAMLRPQAATTSHSPSETNPAMRARRGMAAPAGKASTACRAPNS
jgi:toxin CcdB